MWVGFNQKSCYKKVFYCSFGIGCNEYIFIWVVDCGGRLFLERVGEWKFGWFSGF